MKYLDVTSPTLRRKVGLRRTHWTLNVTVAAMALALVCSQTTPALAFGPCGGLEGRDSVKAMAYFRVPLGGPRAEKDRAPSFGFTVKREFQFADPLYQSRWGSQPNVMNFNVDLMDLRFGMNGELKGFNVGGFNTLRAKTLLNAAADEDGDGGVPNWVWWTAGGVAVLAIAVAWAASQDWEPKCTAGRDGPEIPCEESGFFF